MNISPIIPDKRQPHGRINKIQKKIVSEINSLILDGSFELLENHCMCGNEHEEQDVLLTEKDGWGIIVGQVMCSRCGLIRNKFVFSSNTNQLFYEKYYRRLYNPDKSWYADYFRMQCKRGDEYLEILNKLSIISDIKFVAEYGCGAGGILLPFSNNGNEVIGVDLGDDFLNIGREYGLNLVCGDFDSIIQDNNCDLIIMSHVLEHLTNPIAEVTKIFSKIKEGKYLLVQVPGIFFNYTQNYPLSGFQIAHVYYYYKEWLEVFFEDLGFKILYCDDKCTFVLKKVFCKERTNIIWRDNLSNFPDIILERCLAGRVTMSSLIKSYYYNIGHQLYHIYRMAKRALS